MLMSPQNGGSGGGGHRPRRPSGAVAPTVEATADTPIPVVLTHRTLLKLIAGIVGPLVVILSGAAYFFHATRSHIADPIIHLDRGERGKLQTKADCATSAKKIAVEVKRELRLNHREVVVQQKRQIDKVGERLEAAQRTSLLRILNGIKQGHRITRRTIRRPASPP
jgi:hypothetical protein